MVPTSTSHTNGVVEVYFGRARAHRRREPRRGTRDEQQRDVLPRQLQSDGNAGERADLDTVDGSQATAAAATAIRRRRRTSQNTNCGNCHAGYTQTSVNAATHMNGTVDVGALTCSSCHGDANRVGSPAPTRT